MKLTVVIVNYNVKHYLGQCLDSLEKALAGIDSEIYVVDNHSHDGSVDYLRQHYKGVTVIESSHNLGFARANNIAIRESDSEYVLLLNPDTFVAEDTIREVIAFADAHERTGAIGVMMYNPDGTRANESRRGIPTPMTAFYKMTGFQKRFPQSRRFGRYYMSYLGWEEPVQIEIVSGAFCFLRRSAISDVGLLDTDFFMYGEDIDLSYRLLKGGYENWFLPQRILHYKGESTNKSSFVYVHVFYQAMLIFFRKHYGHLGWVLSLPIKAAIWLSAAITFFGICYRTARKALGFIGKQGVEPRYIFIGRKSMTEQCHIIARRVGITADYYPVKSADEAASLSLDVPGQGTTYVVYDTALLGYGGMISLLSAAPRPNIKIGTYSERHKLIITPDEIYGAKSS